MKNNKPPSEYKRQSGFTIGFDFVPMPTCIWSEAIDLSQAEFRLLDYLLKHVRFGEALEPISDDELLNGVLRPDRNGELQRVDRGCGLSRHGTKVARSSLVDRGWIEAEKVSKDVTRPQYFYRVLLSREVSQRDTKCPNGTPAPEGQQVSQRVTAVSQRDSAVSQRDTCNKEEEKALRKSFTDGGARPPSQSVLIIAQRQLMEAIEADWRRADRKEVFQRVRAAAKTAGLDYTQAKAFLSDHPDWRDWPELAQLDSQAEIEFPDLPKRRPAGEDWKQERERWTRELELERAGGQA